MSNPEKHYATFNVNSVLYFVESVWTQRELTLTVTDGRNIWSGSGVFIC